MQIYQYLKKNWVVTGQKINIYLWIFLYIQKCIISFTGRVLPKILQYLIDQNTSNMGSCYNS